MKAAFLVISAILLFTSSSFGQNLNQLNWILGEWEMVDGSTTTTESWEKLNDSTFVGNGIAKQEDKVVFEEKLSIELRNNQTTYVAVLPNKTAHFRLTESNNGMATFEDAMNDFPSKIIYQLNTEKMDITLFGIQNGEEQNTKMQFIKK